jgi:outer membrane protein TolC
MLRKIPAILAILILWWNNGDAQVILRSVEDAWHYADEHNVTIRIADYELLKARKARTQSKLAFLPTVSANASATDNLNLPVTIIPVGALRAALGTGGPADVVAPIKFGLQYINVAGATGQLDVVNPQTWYNVRTAKETEALNRASVADAKKQAYQAIANEYYGFLLNREAERLAGLSLAVSDSVSQSVSAKYTEGLLNQANVDVAQLNTERARQTYILSHYQARTSLNTLKGLLNLSVDDSLYIEGTLRENVQPVSHKEFEEDPAIAVANYQAKVNYSQYKSVRATVIPTVSVFYNNTITQSSNVFQPFSSVNSFPASYFALRANWNIFTAGSRWLQVQRSKISYLESLAQFDNVQKQSAINDANLWLSYEKTSAVFDNAEKIMNLSYDNYKHISDRYAEGLSSIEERLDAFTDYITYQNRFIIAASDMLVQLYLIKIRQQPLIK